MRLNSLISFAGFIMLVAGTYCPVLRPFHLFNWNVYDANKPFGIVILLVAVVGIISTVFNQVKLTRLTSVLSLALIVLLYIAAWFKIHTSFSFIPFHSIDSYLSRQIRLKWGWYLLFLGAVLAIAGTLFGKKDKFRLG